MIVQLVGIQGPHSDQRFTLAGAPFLLGRELTNTVQIRSQLVSRHHAAILLRDRDYVVVDLNSLNGVLVNKEYVNGERVLQDGDLITIGDATFRFERSSVDIPDHAAAARRAAPERADANGAVGGHLCRQVLAAHSVRA